VVELTDQQASHWLIVMRNISARAPTGATCS
jgi:hypothetical protein